MRIPLRFRTGATGIRGAEIRDRSGFPAHPAGAVLSPARVRYENVLTTAAQGKRVQPCWN
ncbi:hypothetical protein NicSoilB8_40620 [Arthrobacter sp. NicSoilB8]|nr:hypothetical protein NicSoilB8_40620 [Arthrobacter sp. NicSoilB8]